MYDVVAQAGGIVDVCGEEGHWHSADNGATWTRGSALPNGQCSIAASPDETYVLFAVVGTSLFTLTDAQTDAERERPARHCLAGNGTEPLFAGSDPVYGHKRPRRQRRPRLQPVVRGREPALPQLHNPRHRRRRAAPPGARRPRPRTTAPTTTAMATTLNNDNVVTCPAECVDEPDEGWIGRPGGLAGDQANGNRAFTRLSGAHDDAGDIVFDSAVAVDACPEVFSSDGGVYRNTDNGADCVNPDWEQPNVTPHALWLVRHGRVQPRGDRRGGPVHGSSGQRHLCQHQRR